MNDQVRQLLMQMKIRYNTLVKLATDNPGGPRSVEDRDLAGIIGEAARCITQLSLVLDQSHANAQLIRSTTFGLAVKKTDTTILTPGYVPAFTIDSWEALQREGKLPPEYCVPDKVEPIRSFLTNNGAN